jgi:hypothetical protein
MKEFTRNRVYHTLFCFSPEIDHAAKAPSSHHQHGLARPSAADELLFPLLLHLSRCLYQHELLSDAFGGRDSLEETVLGSTRWQAPIQVQEDMDTEAGQMCEE